MGYDDIKLSSPPERESKEWIHVDHRFPAEGSIVWVVNADNDTVKAEYKRGKFYSLDLQKPLFHIELWQPLI